jgi:hypothetical protein
VERPEWGVLRQKACERFGQPTEKLENQIVGVYRRHPYLVADAIDVVTVDYHDGNVRSPWAILAYRVKRDAQRADAADQIHPETVDEPKAVRDTRTRIRNAIYLHEELDVATDEITAGLGPHATPALVGELLEEWRDRRLQVGWG